MFFYYFCTSVSNGKKEEPQRCVFERRMREARRHRRKGSSAEVAMSFNAARGSGGALYAPQRVRAEPGSQTTFWFIFGLKMLYLERPSLAKTYDW